LFNKQTPPRIIMNDGEIIFANFETQENSDPNAMRGFPASSGKN
jgi:hypothetical protein